MQRDWWSEFLRFVFEIVISIINRMRWLYSPIECLFFCLPKGLPSENYIIICGIANFSTYCHWPWSLLANAINKLYRGAVERFLIPYILLCTKREKAPNKAHISSFVVLFSFLAPTNHHPPSSPAMQHWIYLFSPRIIVGYIGTCISTHKFVHCRVVDNCRFVVVELPSRRRQQRSNGIGIEIPSS